MFTKRSLLQVGKKGTCNQSFCLPRATLPSVPSQKHGVKECLAERKCTLCKCKHHRLLHFPDQNQNSMPVPKEKGPFNYCFTAFNIEIISIFDNSHARADKVFIHPLGGIFCLFLSYGAEFMLLGKNLLTSSRPQDCGCPLKDKQHHW
jgi:hypothetical protein